MILLIVMHQVNVMVDGDLVNKFNLGDTVIVTGNMRLDVYNDIVINQFKKKTNDASVYERLVYIRWSNKWTDS